jgi:protein phosphatase
MRSALDGQRLMIIVADGVSTSKYGSGDLASGLLVKCADEYWNEALVNAEKIDAKQAIREILHRCNNEICNYIRKHYANEHPTASESMGTTALVGFVENGRFILGSIGDSRAYLIRENAVACITRDHNLFTMAVVNGMPIQQCAVHPHAGSLVQCLGFFEDLDDSQPAQVDFDIYSINLVPGDHILMTTDGLLDYAAQDIRDAEAIIARTVLNTPDPALACLELILVANRGGGGDNTGIGIINVYDACIMTPFKP